MENLNQLAIWAQIISLPIAIIAILVSVWLYYKSRQRKTIACIFDQIGSPIEFKAGEALDGAIEILYKGKAVKNIFLVRFKIRNTGNIPIRQSDIITPLTFIFEPDVVLLREPRVITQKPSNLNIEWKLNETDNSPKNEISFLFDLLNPNDEISAEFLCTGDVNLPTVVARIEGVRNIDALDPEEKRLKDVAIEGIGIAGIAVFFSLLQKYFPASKLKFPETLGYWIAGIVIAIILAVSILVIWVTIIKPIIELIQYHQNKKSKKR